MDVQCERCKTEYEFDDALVSGRGTTVRCTHCGHQFKVRGPEARDGADQWQVQTTSGQRLTFLSLRELQRAILAKQVTRGDVLTRGAGPARPLGTIAELEPFFEGRPSSRPPPAAGMASAMPHMPFAPSVPDLGSPAPPLSKRTASWGVAPTGAVSPVPPARHKIDTLRPIDSAAPPPPFASFPPPPMETLPVVSATPYAFGQAAMARPGSEDPFTLHGPVPPSSVPALFEGASPAPPPVRPVRPAMPTGDDELPASRSWQPSSADDSASLPRRRRVGGWVVAFVLLLAVGVGGWAVARPYLLARGSTARVELDTRALGFVLDGEKALADGNLDLSQEDFDKASALAEHDPRVLLDEARVSAAKTDIPWLSLRLLPPAAVDEVRATRAQLADRLARTRKAADDAVAASPDDPAAVRAKIDALRLGGEGEAARSYVGKIAAQVSQPETAYVLAALDLAESDPLWTTVIDRLRQAAAGEGNAGRARSALVYALAKSGDGPGARVELAKLDGLSRPYPLLPQLHGFVDRVAGKSSLDGGVASNAQRPELGASPSPSVAAGGGGAGAGSVPGGSSSAMQGAAQAIKKGDWNRARQIYEAIVARNPTDSEALAGIGDVDRAQGNNAGAVSAYRRALAVNPSYLPALLGVADTQWVSGDRGSAQRAYKDIEDRFPDGTYPGYVKTRVEPSPPPAPATPAPPTPTASDAPPPKPASPADSDGL
jgi:predicted Zn finger-like uncharacterized protein